MVLLKDVHSIKPHLFFSLFHFLDAKLQGVPDLSSFGDVYELGFGLGPNQPPTSAVLKKEFQRKISFQLSPQEVLVFHQA